MSEDLDLNALRRKAVSQEQVPKSNAERIIELQEKIREAGGRSEQGNELARFDSLSPDDQVTEVERVARNRGLSPDTFTLEDRRRELESSDSGLQANTIRLDLWREELSRLSEASEGGKDSDG